MSVRGRIMMCLYAYLYVHVYVVYVCVHVDMCVFV
jgi:hypothetical protein